MRDYARLAGKVVWKRTPEQFIFFVTSKCPQNCKICFYKKGAHLQEPELTIDEIQKISSGMPPIYWLQISGGEPFLRDDLDQICGIFVRNNRTRLINIPTNASQGERVLEISKRALTANPRAFFNIGISLLGPRDIHDTITGTHGSFDKAIACYQALRELKGFYPNLGLNFTVTQSIDNEAVLKELFDLLMREYQPDHIAFNFARGLDLAHKYSGSSPQLYLENWNHLFSRVLQRERYYYDLPLKSLLYAVNMLQKEITYQVASRDRFVIPCYAARISTVLDETGNLYACEMRKQRLGNFRESNYSFRAIWHGPHAENERRSILRNRCFCTHECFITTNILFNVRMYTALLCAWLRYGLKLCWAIPAPSSPEEAPCDAK